MKILQINVFRFSYYKQLVEYIKKENPDIITMQEVDLGGWFEKNCKTNLLDKLAKELGYELHFSPRYYKSYKNHKEQFAFGNAILSKFKIISHTTLYPPHFSKQNLLQEDNPLFTTQEHLEKYKYAFDLPEPIGVVLLDTPQGLIRVYNIHLNVSYFGIENLMQMKSIDYLLEQYKHFNKLPTIISGDFNLESKTYSIETLGKKFTRANSKFTNSLNPSNHGIFNDRKEGSCVDHIFLSNDFSIDYCQIEQVDISDHLPILCEFELK